MQAREHTGGTLDLPAGNAIDIAKASGLSPSGSNVAHGWFARREDTAARVQPTRTLPALTRAELVLSGGGKRPVARRPTRIPTDAIVGIGRKAPADPKQAPRLDRKTPVANDNQRRLSPKLRTFLREMFFLLLFGATLAGTYYVGRLHAFQNVISVPDTPTKDHRIV